MQWRRERMRTDRLGVGYQWVEATAGRDFKLADSPDVFVVLWSGVFRGQSAREILFRSTSFDRTD